MVPAAVTDEVGVKVRFVKQESSRPFTLDADELVLTQNLLVVASALVVLTVAVKVSLVELIDSAEMVVTTGLS